jgi:hypothetical protein
MHAHVPRTQYAADKHPAAGPGCRSNDKCVERLPATAITHTLTGLRPACTHHVGLRALYFSDHLSSSVCAITVNTGPKPRATAKSIDMSELSALFRRSMDVQDRRYRLVKYHNCFVGTQAVTWLCEWLRQRDYDDTEQEGVTLGNQLMDLGMFEHVTKDHILKNQGLFYTFVDDSSVYPGKAHAADSAPASPVDDTDREPASAGAGDSDGMEEDIDAMDMLHNQTARFSIDGYLEDDAGMFDAGMFDAGSMEAAWGADMDMATSANARSDAKPPNQHGVGAGAESSPSVPAIKVEAEAVQVAAGSMLSTGVAVEFDLRTKRWKHINSAAIPWREKPHTLTKDMVQSIPVKGRHSREEKDAERRAEEILRTPGWSVTRATALEDLEHLVVVLVKCLERCVRPGAASPMAWCVGGSLQATLDARGPDGTTSSVCFVLCNEGDWTGDKRSKIGNTCKFHCGSMRASNIMVAGHLRAEVNLKKCTWLKCCYGKKHYGDPPLIPWCSQCEYQKKLLKRESPSDSAHLARGKSKCGIPKARPCNDCLAQLQKLRATGADVRSFMVCGSCNTLMGKLDSLAKELAVSNYAMADSPARSTGGAITKRQRKEVPEAFRSQLRDVMLVVFAELGIKAHAMQLDPIILDALQSKYGADTIGELWDAHEDARATMMRLVLRNIALGYHLYQAVQNGGANDLPPNHAALLRTVSMPDFISSWNAVLVRDGCVMVAYTCGKGFADAASQIIGMNSDIFTSLGVSAAASIVSGELARVVCVNGLAAEEPLRRTFGACAVSLAGNTVMLAEMVQHGFEADAIRWLQIDSSLIEWRAADGKTVLHLACAAAAQSLLQFLLRYEGLQRSLPRLLSYMRYTDAFGKTAVQYCQVTEVREMIESTIIDVSATILQKYVRGHLVRRSSRVLARILAQSLADAELNADRLQYMKQLASACSDGDNSGAQMWCDRLKEFALETLDLDDMNMEWLPPAVCSDSMASLEILSLMNNSLSALPAEIKCLPFLQKLFLDDNDFTVLPAVVCEMDSLELLSVRNNKLTALPARLLDLARLQHLFAVGNPLNAELAPLCNNWSAIRECLRSRHHSLVRDTYHTVILIGADGAAKSSLAQALQPQPSTGLRGLWSRTSATAEFTDVQLSVVEFGGDGVQSSVTPFVSQRMASYVLVCDIAKPDWQSQLRSLLARVAAHTVANTCQVTVVGSQHTGHDCSVSVEMIACLAEQYPMLDVTRVFTMSSCTANEVREFRSHIYSIASHVLQAQPPVHAIFMEIYELVRQLGQVDGPILSVAEVCQATEKYLGAPATTTLHALRHLAAGGRLVHLHGRDNDVLDVVVADISWLGKLFEAVRNVSAEHENGRSGVIDVAKFHTALDHCSEQDPAISLRLLLKLEICFPTTVGIGSVQATKAVVVPSLLEPGPSSIPWPQVPLDTECAGYGFTTREQIPSSFFHRLQTQLHLRVDRRCTLHQDSVELSGSSLGCCNQRAWLRFDRGGRRLDVVVVGQHPGPAVAILVDMVEQMKNDSAYPGLRSTLKRQLLYPSDIRAGQLPELLDEEGIRDAATHPSLLAAKQRLALARSRLSVASKQRICAALPAVSAIAAAILRSGCPRQIGPSAMLLLHENGQLNVAITGMVSFDSHPRSVTILRGDVATFSVRASGVQPITFQWYRGAQLLPGETNDTVTIASVGCDEEGSYSCVASNEVGSVRSVSAALSSYVSYPDPVETPTLVSALANKMQLSWTRPWASGESVVEYRIRVRRQSKQDGSTPPEQTISGFAGPSATICGLELATAYHCCVAARNYAGWGPYGPWSEPFSTLKDPPPEISELRFETTPYSFEIEPLKITGVMLNDDVDDETVTGHGDTSEAKLEPPPCIETVVSPRRCVVAVDGDVAAFAVDVHSTTPFSIQWYREDQILETETLPTLHMSPLDATREGTYYCRVSGDSGEVRTRDIQVVVCSESAIAIGECVCCNEESKRLWTLDCKCRCRRGFFGVCAQCTQEFVFGTSRCPMCGDVVNGVKRSVDTNDESD